jgi:acetyl esterase
MKTVAESIEIADMPQFAAETADLLDRLSAAATEQDPYQALLTDREDLPDPEVAGVRDPRVDVEALIIELPGRSLEARLYRYDDRPRPTVLWLHGGGFVGGHLRDIEYTTSGIAHAGRANVVALNYRLAPENPYPAALDDVRDTLDWLRGSELNSNGRLIIGGQSAGAALAAGACLLLRDEGGRLPDQQILCYPVLDLHTDADWHDWYLPMPTADIPAAAVPLLAESLAGLPPALVLAAGRDDLRPDALAYAMRLREEGVPARLVEYAGTMHAFLNFPAVLSAGRHAVELIGAELSARHSSAA